MSWWHSSRETGGRGERGEGGGGGGQSISDGVAVVGSTAKTVKKKKKVHVSF